MARMTQQDLEKLVKKKPAENPIKSKDHLIDESNSNDQIKIALSDNELKEVASKIIGEKKSGSNYSVPTEGFENSSNFMPIPKVNIFDYPQIQIKGQFPSNRQRRSSNLMILKEIDLILERTADGNRNATLNFLIWVGLQTLKGANKDKITINVNSNTYADGRFISEYQKSEELVS